MEKGGVNGYVGRRAVEGLCSYLAQKDNHAVHSGENWLADAVEAGLAKAGLSRPAKAEPDGR